jgi:hypothetical protein
LDREAARTGGPPEVRQAREPSIHHAGCTEAVAPPAVDTRRELPITDNGHIVMTKAVTPVT